MLLVVLEGFVEIFDLLGVEEPLNEELKRLIYSKEFVSNLINKYICIYLSVILHSRSYLILYL